MLYDHASAMAVITVKIQMVSNLASHDDQGSSSREQANGDDDPFPVHYATEHVAYPLQPAIFVPE
jgi:hypothetical protein